MSQFCSQSSDLSARQQTRSAYSYIKGPLAQSTTKSARGDPHFLCPISHALRFAVICNIAITPLVAVLLCTGRPPHIVGFVVSFVVYALYRVFWAGTHTNVFDEYPEVQPSRIKADTSRAVVFIARMIWVLNASLHLNPYFVFRSICHPVRRVCLDGSTPTRASAALLQIVCDYGGNATTDALTLPMPRSGFCAIRSHKFPNNSQPSEYHSNRVLGYNFFSHGVNLHDRFTKLVRASMLHQQLRGSLILTRGATR